MTTAQSASAVPIEPPDDEQTPPLDDRLSDIPISLDPLRYKTPPSRHYNKADVEDMMASLKYIMNFSSTSFETPERGPIPSSRVGEKNLEFNEHLKNLVRTVLPSSHAKSARNVWDWFLAMVTSGVLTFEQDKYQSVPLDQAHSHRPRNEMALENLTQVAQRLTEMRTLLSGRSNGDPERLQTFSSHFGNVPPIQHSLMFLSKKMNEFQNSVPPNSKLVENLPEFIDTLVRFLHRMSPSVVWGTMHSGFVPPNPQDNLPDLNTEKSSAHMVALVPFDLEKFGGENDSGEVVDDLVFNKACPFWVLFTFPNKQASKNISNNTCQFCIDSIMYQVLSPPQAAKMLLPILINSVLSYAHSFGLVPRSEIDDHEVMYTAALYGPHMTDYSGLIVDDYLRRLPMLNGILDDLAYSYDFLSLLGCANTLEAPALKRMVDHLSCIFEMPVDIENVTRHAFNIPNKNLLGVHRLYMRPLHPHVGDGGAPCMGVLANVMNTIMESDRPSYEALYSAFASWFENAIRNQAFRDVSSCKYLRNHIHHDLSPEDFDRICADIDSVDPDDSDEDYQEEEVDTDRVDFERDHLAFSIIDGASHHNRIILRSLYDGNSLDDVDPSLYGDVTDRVMYYTGGSYNFTSVCPCLPMEFVDPGIDIEHRFDIESDPSSFGEFLYPTELPSLLDSDRSSPSSISSLLEEAESSYPAEWSASIRPNLLLVHDFIEDVYQIHSSINPELPRFLVAARRMSGTNAESIDFSLYLFDVDEALSWTTVNGVPQSSIDRWIINYKTALASNNPHDIALCLRELYDISLGAQENGVFLNSSASQFCKAYQIFLFFRGRHSRSFSNLLSDAIADIHGHRIPTYAVQPSMNFISRFEVLYDHLLLDSEGHLLLAHAPSYPLALQHHLFAPRIPLSYEDHLLMVFTQCSVINMPFTLGMNLIIHSNMNDALDTIDWSDHQYERRGIHLRNHFVSNRKIVEYLHDHLQYCDFFTPQWFDEHVVPLVKFISEHHKHWALDFTSFQNSSISDVGYFALNALTIAFHSCLACLNQLRDARTRVTNFDIDPNRIDADNLGWRVRPHDTTSNNSRDMPSLVFDDDSVLLATRVNRLYNRLSLGNLQTTSNFPRARMLSLALGATLRQHMLPPMSAFFFFHPDPAFWPASAVQCCEVFKRLITLLNSRSHLPSYTYGVPTPF